MFTSQRSPAYGAVQHVFNESTTFQPLSTKDTNVNSDIGKHIGLGIFVMILFSGLTVLLWNRYLRWRKHLRRQRSKSQHLRVSSAAAYSNAWRDSEGLSTVFGDMDAAAPLGDNDVELENFGRREASWS